MGRPAVYSAGMQPPSYPGAVEPERGRTIESLGLRLNLIEWGDPAATPFVLCHGMFDHARSFATLAPLLADRFRVIAVDARGHGDSDWAEAYNWPVDVADIVAVLRSLGRPSYLLGHSKGGGQATDAACLVPELVVKLVNIDGFGPPPSTENLAELPSRFAQYLDSRRRRGAQHAWRAYASLDELVERRRAQNPRLSREWLRYFLFHGARESEDGWRWKSDPIMGFGFGPWRPDWVGPGFVQLKMPMLAITGSEDDTWGPLPAKLLAERLAYAPQMTHRVIAGAGHFVHIEQPEATAAAILGFLDS
jgi:pimeloyl-ACP methyl ester carboxylesterase